MKTLEEIKGIIARHKGNLRQKYKVKEIGIFGSYARGEQKEVSDVDVLVEFEDLLDLVYPSGRFFGRPVGNQG